MKIGQKQEVFALLLAKLIIKIYESGYSVRIGDVFAKKRDPLEHKKNSQHYLKLAADLNLFKDGAFLETTDAHKVFGDYWESLHPLCRWGGRWGDGNHYELRPSAKGGE
jgi:hypothetical protein